MSDAVSEPEKAERRPIASRQLRIMQRVADWLIARRVPPNAISLSSIAFAALAGLCLLATTATGGGLARLFFVLAALCVQGRLLANLFDGMVAVGSGQASKLGEIYNDVPDRIADVLILVGAGFGLGGSPVLGCAAAMLALFVAYLRLLGNALGVGDLFIGPMAKPQRMATVTAVSAYLALAPAEWPFAIASESVGALSLGLALVVAGAIVTSVRRLQRIATSLQSRA
jgi:phosphatidylglycerophosphate synthase